MIGILAGMGPKSTGPFVDNVILQCQQMYGAKDDIDFPEMMIYACPTPFYTNRPIDHKEMELAIIKGAKKLERTGVDFIAMPCNTAHLYIHTIRQSISVSLVDIVEETVNEIPKKTKKVALLATQATVDSSLYDSYLHDYSYIRKNKWQLAVNEVITVIKEGHLDEATRIWKNLYKELQASVDGCILACTDLNVVIHTDENPSFFIDSSTCLAKAVVREYINRNRRGDK
jgi:aspartate racemase